MKKYIVTASETVIYEIEVEANSSHEAREKVLNGEVEIPEPIDGNGFQIEDVKE